MSRIELLGEAIKELIPYDYYYNIDFNVSLPNKLHLTKKHFVDLVRLNIFLNNNAFVKFLMGKTEIEFKKELDVQFAAYYMRSNNSTEWLEHTTKLIRKEIKDRYLIHAFNEWLKDMQPLSQPQQQKSLPIIEENNEPTLKQLALYHVYLGTNINKDNANDYLKDTSHKASGKLKQEFDKYSLTNNRIFSGSDRENSFKLKLFKSVIEMLKKTDNTDAVIKAEKDLIQFEKNIA